MKILLFLQIAFRIILVFGTGMLMSLITPKMHEFFGDTKCIEYCHGYDKWWHWSATHYWFHWCLLFLFILSLISSCIAIASALKKEYPQFCNK